jgi:hypothetical protein
MSSTSTRDRCARASASLHDASIHPSSVHVCSLQQSRLQVASDERRECINIELQGHLVDDCCALVCAYAKQQVVVLVAGGYTQSPDNSNNSRNGNSDPSVAVYNPATDQWQQLPQWLDANEYVTNRGTAMGGLVHILGRRHDGMALHRCLDLMTWETTELPACYMDEQPTAVTALNGDLYSWRGQQLKCFPRAQQRWVHRAGTRLRHAAALVVTHDQHIYTLGGIIAALTFTGDVERYDPACDSWSVCASMKAAHTAASGVSADGHVYVCGGVGSRLGVEPDVCERYSPQQDRWTTIAPLLQQRLNAVAAFIDGRILVCGGCFVGGRVSAESYNLKSDTWTLVAPMPHPRWKSVAAVI